MQHIQTDQYNSDIGYQIQQFMLQPLCKFWFWCCHVSTTLTVPRVLDMVQYVPPLQLTSTSVKMVVRFSILCHDPIINFWFWYCHVSTTPYTLLMTTQTNNTAKIMNMKDVKKAENKDSKDKKRKQVQGRYDTLDHEYRKALHQYQQAAHSIHHETCQHHHIAWPSTTTMYTYCIATITITSNVILSVILFATNNATCKALMVNIVTSSCLALVNCTNT